MLLMQERISFLRWPAKTRARAFQSVALLALLIGWLGLTRYLYGGQPLLPLAAMALHTSAMFVILSVTTLTLRVDASLMALISGAGAGGATARRLLPTVVLMPLLLARAQRFRRGTARGGRLAPSDAGAASAAANTSDR